MAAGVSRIQILVVLSAVVGTSVLAFMPETTYEAQALDFMDQAALSSGLRAVKHCNNVTAAADNTDSGGNATAAAAACEYEVDCQARPLGMMPPNVSSFSH